jgi:hypothetical protein
MNPFARFKVYPSLGKGVAAVEWQLAPGVSGGVHIYRSEEGIPDTWERLTVEPLGFLGVWEDETVPRTDAFAHHYYRGLVTPTTDKATWLRGESYSALGTLTRREHHLLKAIMRREWKNMRVPNGVEAWYCIPRATGEWATGVDEVIGGAMSTPCPHDPAFGFGEAKAGGFHAPMLTRVRVMAIGDLAEAQRPEDQGFDQDKDVSLRLLAFPRPRSGHMVCLKDSDRRYVISDPIKPFWFKADHAVAWECVGKLLDRRDARHLFPMPGRA